VPPDHALSSPSHESEGGEIDGAAEALTPVLDLPPEQRINGIMQSMNQVHQSLNDMPTSATARILQERIGSYASLPFARWRNSSIIYTHEPGGS
jgi:hypothetical protein